MRWTSHVCGNSERTALKLAIPLQAAVRRWLARQTEVGACHAQKDDWDRCLASSDSAAHDHSQPGSSNTAAMLVLDKAAECLAVGGSPGCMASSDCCSIPLSSLPPARSLDVTKSEHGCRPLDKAAVMAVDAESQGLHIDDEELAGLNLQGVQLLLELHDDWRKHSIRDKQCEADAAVTDQHASDDTACHETLQDSHGVSETVCLQTVSSGSSCNLEQVCKADHASCISVCGS